MAERFVEVNYSPNEGLTLRFRPAGLQLIPEPTRGHLRAANKELLMAFRSWLDQVIEGVEKQEGQEADHRPRKVPVKAADNKGEAI